MSFEALAYIDTELEAPSVLGGTAHHCRVHVQRFRRMPTWTSGAIAKAQIL